MWGNNFILPTWAKWVAALIVMLFVYFYGQQQYKRGEVAGSVAYLKRTNADLAEANDLIIKLQREARNAEMSHQLRLAALDAHYQEKQAHEQAQNDVVVRNLRAGIAKLQYRTPIASSQQAGTDSTSAAGPGPSGSDGAQTSELPATIAADLFTLAADADGVAKQLGACQEIVAEDRRLCGTEASAITE